MIFFQCPGCEEVCKIHKRHKFYIIYNSCISKRNNESLLTMKNLIKLCPMLFLVIHSGQNLSAQVHNFDTLYKNNEYFRTQIENTPEYEDLFLSDEVMDITIGSDFKNLVKKKGKDEYQPALFQYLMNDTVLLTRNITIRPRGQSRKNVCRFPPLKLNFSRENEVLVQFKEFDKLKMVLDCKNGNLFEQYLLSEFMAYKLLNILTEYSYRVRLIRVTYIDAGGKYDTETRYAFLVENKDQMAERLNSMPINVKGIRDELIDNGTLINSYLFQFMIGNTDWSIPGDHNMDLIKSKDPVITKPFVIPFDFDLAGIVDANYAFPAAELGISSVRDRLYMGICLPEGEIKAGVKVFLDKKGEIYALYQNAELLDNNNKRKTISYLDGFYEVVEDEGQFNQWIIESCGQNRFK